MVTSKTVDRLTLQRLVDGELDHVERAGVLRDLECSPEQWRDVAMALLEEQQLHRDIATAVCEARNLDTIRVPKQISSLPASSLSRSSKVSSNMFWSMAASIVFVVGGFAAGSYLRGLSPRQDLASEASPTNGTLATNPQATNLRATSTLGDPSIVETGTMRLVSDEGLQRPLEVPVYEVSRVDDRSLFGLDESEFRQLERDLRRRGIKLDVDTEILEGKLQDGRQIVVPVRNFQVRPYGQ